MAPSLFTQLPLAQRPQPKPKSSTQPTQQAQQVLFNRVGVHSPSPVRNLLIEQRMEGSLPLLRIAAGRQQARQGEGVEHGPW